MSVQCCSQPWPPCEHPSAPLVKLAKGGREGRMRRREEVHVRVRRKEGRRDVGKYMYMYISPEAQAIALQYLIHTHMYMYKCNTHWMHFY